MDYYVLDKEEDTSNCGILDLGKCIGGSNDTVEETVFTTTTVESNSGEGARGEVENTSSTSDYHGEETRVIGSEDHIMQFISGTEEVGSTEYRESSHSQLGKSMNECDSATDSMLKDIININVEGVSPSNEITHSARAEKEKPEQPVIDQSSTDEDSSKSLVSSETPSDVKKAKTLDDILDDFCDENSDTITSQTSSTTDTDDSTLLASKNPLFETDKEEDSKVPTGEIKMDNNLQKFVEGEEDLNLQKLVKDDKFEGEMKEGNKMFRESGVNSKDMQGLDIQKSREEEVAHDDNIEGQGENISKFSGCDDQSTKITTVIKNPQQNVIHDDNNALDANKLRNDENLTKLNTAIGIPQTPVIHEENNGLNPENVVLKASESSIRDIPVKEKNEDSLTKSDPENREEQMKNHNTLGPIKKKGLKLARHNINTEVTESESPIVFGGLENENSNKRDLGDSEETARKKLKTVNDTDIETIIEKPSEMKDTEMSDKGNQITKIYEDNHISIESTVIGFEVDLHSESQFEKDPLNGLPHVENAATLSDTCNRETESLESNVLVQEKHTLSGKPEKESSPMKINEKAVEEERVKESICHMEDESVGTKETGERPSLPHKEEENIKESDSHMEVGSISTKETAEKPCLTHEKEEVRVKEQDGHMEDETISTKESAVRSSLPHGKDIEVETQKKVEKVKTVTVQKNNDVSLGDGRSSSVSQHTQEITDDFYADFDEESIENISRTIRSFTSEKVSPKKPEKPSSNQKEDTPSKRVIMVKTAPNVEKVKRKLEEILEKSKGEEDAAIAELQRMKKEKTDILNAITTEMEKLKSLLVKGKQG